MIVTTLGNSRYIIHHPSEVEVYALTREQIELLSRDDASEWKVRASGAISVLMTCIINLLAIGWDIENKSFSFNILIGLISLSCSVLFLYLYMGERKKYQKRLEGILSQPVQGTIIKGEAM